MESFLQDFSEFSCLGDRVSSEKVNHPGWEGFGNRGPSNLHAGLAGLKFVRKTAYFPKISHDGFSNTSEVVSDEGFVANRERVSGRIAHGLANNDETPGVLHLGAQFSENRRMAKTLRVRHPNLGFGRL